MTEYQGEERRNGYATMRVDIEVTKTNVEHIKGLLEAHLDHETHMATKDDLKTHARADAWGFSIVLIILVAILGGVFFN